MCAMKRSLVIIFSLVALAGGMAGAQNRRAVTTADYDRAVKMLAPALTAWRCQLELAPGGRGGFQ